ncbi:MAG: hypothetical protein ABWY21_19100, partial [Rhodococcus sp. (in: high G+C Gram-positive bacteria)]
RLITKTGVQYKDRSYDSVDLHPFRNTKTDDVANSRKWTVAVDPYDELIVWVKAPDNTWIECHTKDRKNAITPNFDPGALTTDRTTLAAEHGIGASALPYSMPAEWLDEETEATTSTEETASQEIVGIEESADIEAADLDETTASTTTTSTYREFNPEED